MKKIACVLRSGAAVAFIFLFMQNAVSVSERCEIAARVICRYESLLRSCGKIPNEYCITMEVENECATTITPSPAQCRDFSNKHMDKIIQLLNRGEGTWSIVITLGMCDQGEIPVGFCSGNMVQCPSCAYCVYCSNCHDDANWGSYGRGYQRKTSRKCDCRLGCLESILYRCSDGYYGSSSNGVSGCNQCPDGGISEAGRNQRVTDCFITHGSDHTGDFDFGGQKCFYTP